MTWMIGNVVVRLDANNNIVPDKKKSRQRIDGVSATIFALACALRMNIEPPKKKEFKVHVWG